MNTDRGFISVLVVVVVLAIVSGALLVAVMVGNSPQVIAARAEQEQARADRERAAAAESWTRAEALRAALPDLTKAIQVSTYGGAAAAVILMVGLSFAFVAFVNIKARTAYPQDGKAPVFTTLLPDGGIGVLDTSRMIGPGAAITGQGKLIAPKFSEQALLQQSQSALAASVMVAAVNADSENELTEKIKAATEGLAGLMPLPQFGAGAGKLPALSGPQLEQLELAEFLRQGVKIRDFARVTWIGTKDKKPFRFSTGRECSRAMYDDYRTQLIKAHVLRPKGNSYELACDLSEAEEVMGLGNSGVQSDA